MMMSPILVTFLALLACVFLCVVVILRGWPPQNRRAVVVATLRRQVALDTLSGVEQEHRTSCIQHARRLLRQAADNKQAALLHASGAQWVVCVGSKLSVVVDGDVTVEYYGDNPPLFRLRRRTDDHTTPQLQQADASADADACPANLVEVRGSSCVPIACIAVELPILRFASLQSAAAALADDNITSNPSKGVTTQYIVVGGARHHPVYYLVPVYASSVTSSILQQKEDCHVAAECRSRVWVQKI